MEILTTAPLLSGSTVGAGERASENETKTGATAGANFQDFLRLLTAQLRNQDPLAPLDSTQFVAQLASFSTVEQLVGVNDRLDAQAATAAAADFAGFAGWIGHAASAIDGRFTASGGPEPFRVPPIAGAGQIEAVVRTADGTEIDRFPVVPDAAGQAIWTRAAELGVAPGAELRIELIYNGIAGVIDRRPAGVFRQITGLRGTVDGPVFELAGGGTLAPADVAELRDAASISGTGSPVAD